MASAPYSAIVDYLLYCPEQTPPAGLVTRAADRPDRARYGKALLMDHTYRVTEIVGSSRETIDQAVRNAVARANETLRHLDWFEVTEIRGHLVDGQIGHFQVSLKVGFRLDERSEP
jgi:flavin-binding protein dodecin